MYQNILIAIDNVSSDKITGNAISTALAFNSKLTICHIKKNSAVYHQIDPTGLLTSPHMFIPDFSYSIDEELERIKKTALDAGVKEVEIVQTFSSSPGLAIADVIAPGYDVDLIICGSSHKTTLDRLLLGSVSTEIIRNAKCDVKLVRNP